MGAPGDNIGAAVIRPTGFSKGCMMSEGDASDEWIRVGARIRAARVAANMSVRELARRVAVSSSHISQVERGLASCSVRTLYNVAMVLGLSMDSLFEELPADDTTPDEQRPGTNSGAPATSPAQVHSAGIVLRADARPAIPLEGGTRWERLTPHSEVGAEFIEVIYPPGQEAPPPGDFVRHVSREYGLVLSGTLTVQVGFDQTVLYPGDSIAFDSHIPHRFWNESPDEVRAVWFILDRASNDHSEAVAPMHPGARQAVYRSRNPTDPGGKSLTGY